MRSFAAVIAIVAGLSISPAVWAESMTSTNAADKKPVQTESVKPQTTRSQAAKPAKSYGKPKASKTAKPKSTLGSQPAGSSSH